MIGYNTICINSFFTFKKLQKIIFKIICGQYYIKYTNISHIIRYLYYAIRL